MQKTFLYHAQANVLGGFITKPEQKVVETVAGVSLPITGGHHYAQVNGYCFDTPIITIASATAQVSGSRDGNGVYNTNISTTINGLVIADIRTKEKIITADGVEMNIKTQHAGDDREATVVVTGKFHNLIVKGEPVVFELDSMLSAAPTYTQFDQQFGSNPHVGKSKRTGIIRCSLLKKVGHTTAQPPTDQQSLKIPDFGTVYLGEVYLQQNTRRISMMRLELGSPVVGSLSLGGGEGNGTTVP